MTSSPPRLVIPATRPVDVTTSVPGSKSVANRALVCAALARGTSLLHGVPIGDDTDAMIDGLEALGVDIGRTGDVVRVVGCAGVLAGGSVNARLAGTTSRFSLALGMCATDGVRVDGDETLRSRPMEPLLAALRDVGCTVESNDGRLPAMVQGPARVDTAAIRGDISSQYISALMMAGAVLPAGLSLTLTSELVSRPYVELTEHVMHLFGHESVSVSADQVQIGPGGYTATEMSIEPDASSASYPLALVGLIAGRVTVSGLGTNSHQGDAIFGDILAAMGVAVEIEDDSITAHHGGGPLTPININLADASDLVPTVAVLAAVADGTTTLRGIGFIRGKESDRIADVASLLTAFGVDAVPGDDDLTIHGQGGRNLRAPHHPVATHHDHRLAMAAGLLGTRTGSTFIDDPDVVAKSWPEFWEALTTWTQ